jgi:hypothetical protein
MHINLNDAVKAAEAGDPTRLIHAMAAHCFAVADYPAAKMRELRDRFPAAYAEACSDRYFEAARYGTLDKLLATSTNSSNAGADSRPSAIYARRAAEREARTTAVWDEAIANANRRLGVENDPGKPRRVSFL